MAKKDKMVSEPLLISGELNLGPSKAETRRGVGIALMIAGPNNSKIPETWNCPRLKRVLVRKDRYSISHISASLAKLRSNARMLRTVQDYGKSLRLQIKSAKECSKVKFTTLPIFVVYSSSIISEILIDLSLSAH